MSFLDNMIKGLPKISLIATDYVNNYIARRQARAMGPGGWTMLWGAGSMNTGPYSIYNQNLGLYSNYDNMYNSIFNTGSYSGTYQSSQDWLCQYIRDKGEECKAQIAAIDPTKIKQTTSTTQAQA